MPEKKVYIRTDLPACSPACHFYSYDIKHGTTPKYTPKPTPCKWALEADWHDDMLVKCGPDCPGDGEYDPKELSNA